MDIKDLGKQLDGLSSNNSFDNAIFLPNDVADILPKCIYWNKEVEAMWVQNPQEEDNIKRLCTSFFVTIKTNEKGLFINGNLAVKWDNKRIVKENAVMYQSHGAALALMEKGIICKFRDDDIDSMIMFDVDEEIKKFIEENQSKYISLNLCNVSYWKKEEICVVRSTETTTPKYKGKIIANETGLYLDGELRYCWDDYLPIVRKKNDNLQLSLLKKTELAYWGDNEHGFYPQKNYFVMSDNAIMDKEETILIGFAAKIGTNYDSLGEKKDLPVLKSHYTSLSIQDKGVFSQNIKIHYKGFTMGLFYLFIDFKWLIDTNIFCLDFSDYFYKYKDERLVKASNMRFLESSFTLVIDKQISYTLKLATSNSDESLDHYFYDINKKIIREISFAKRLDIKIKGNDWDYSVKANELIDLAKTFDRELFDSPKHEMDFYKADFYFEKNEYLDANRYISAAIKEMPNNSQYNELAVKIKSKLIEIETENYNKAQKLFDEKQYEQSIKQLDSIHIVEREESIMSLKKKAVDAWFIDLNHMGDTNMAKKNTTFAINNYKQALKLHPDDANVKAKLQQAEKALSSKMKEYAKKALKVIGILLILLVGLIIYDRVMEHKEAQEYKAEWEAKRANDEIINNIIETRLNEICKELSIFRGDTDKYLTKELKSLLDKGWKIGQADFIDSNIWLDAQDHETITVDILHFTNYSESKVDVKLHFIDSWAGRTPKKTITFILEDGNWFVDDIISEDGKSLKKYAKDYVNRYSK